MDRLVLMIMIMIRKGKLRLHGFRNARCDRCDRWKKRLVNERTEVYLSDRCRNDRCDRYDR